MAAGDMDMRFPDWRRTVQAPPADDTDYSGYVEEGGNSMAVAIERLGERLFVLSDRLRRIGALDSDNVHSAYEAVVAAFQALPDPITPSTRDLCAGTMGPIVKDDAPADPPANEVTEAMAVNPHRARGAQAPGPLLGE